MKVHSGTDPCGDKSSEQARNLRNREILFLLLGGVGVTQTADANPVGGVVVAGSGGGTTNILTTDAGNLVVQQQQRRVVIDWTSFNIASGESVTFFQPDNGAIAVNRVTGGLGASFIDGALRGFVPQGSEGLSVPGGNIWVLNPAGIAFGANARVDVHGLLAATANLASPADFVAAADGAPIAFIGSPAGGAINIDSGAQIRAHGGAAMFIAGGGEAGTLTVSGSVTGSGSTDEQNSSQIIYGAAEDFTLRFSAAPPNALTSGDLELFDFIVDTGYSLSSGAAANLSTQSVINVNATSATRAGQVVVAGNAATVSPTFVPFEDNPDFTRTRSTYRVSGPLTATSARGRGADLLINGAGGLRDGAADGAISEARTEIDFIRTDVAPSGFVALTSAGALAMRGRSMAAWQKVGVIVPEQEFQHQGAFNAQQGVLIETSGNQSFWDWDFGGATIASGGYFRLATGYRQDILLGNVDVGSFFSGFRGNVDSTQTSVLRAISFRSGNITSPQRIAMGNFELGIRTGALNAGTFVGFTSSNAATATGFIETGPINAGTFISLIGERAITINGGAAAAGSVELTTALDGAISTKAVTGLDIDFGATGTLETGALTSTTGAIAGNGASRLRVLGNVDGASAVALQSGSGAVDLSSPTAGAPAFSVTARNGAATLSAPQGVRVGAVQATGAVTVAASSGLIQTGALSSSASFVNVEGGSGPGIETGALNAATDVVARGANVAIAGGINAGGRIEVQAQTGSATIGTGAGGAITSTGSASVIGQTGVAVQGAVDAGTSVSLASAAGAVNVGAAGQPASVRARAGQAFLSGRDGVTAGNVAGDSSGATSPVSAVYATSSNGLVQLGNLAATGGLFLNGRGGVSVGDVAVAGAAGVPFSILSQDGMVSVGALTSPGAVTISNGQDIVAASITAPSVNLNATSGAVRIGTGAAAAFAPGSVTATEGEASLVGRSGVSAGSISATNGAVTVRADAGAVSTGALAGAQVTASAAGALSVGGAATPLLRLTATGPDGNVTLSGESRLSGESLVSASADLTVSGPVNWSGTAGTGGEVEFVAGGRFTAAAPITLVGVQGSGVGPELLVRAADVDLRADLAVQGDAGAPGAIRFIASSETGMTLGDGFGGSDFVISDAEFARLRAGLAAFYVGSAGSEEAGGVLTVGNLTIDRSRTAEVQLLTGAYGELNVAGSVLGVGRPDISTSASADDIVDALSPFQITVSGSLGRQGAPLGVVRFGAYSDPSSRSGDIILGSAAFIAEYLAAPSRTAFDPRTLAPTFGGLAPGHQFIVADQVAFGAAGSVMQQNTGFGLPDGIRVGAISSSLPLVNPGDNENLGENVESAPVRVEIYARLTPEGGAAVTGRDAALLSGLLDEGAPASELYRINGCVIGSAVNCTTPATGIDTATFQAPPVAIELQQALPPPGPESEPSGGGGEEGASEPSQTRRTGPIIDTTDPNAGGQDLSSGLRESGVGTANEDLWPLGGL